MAYQIVFSKSAVKELENLPAQVVEKVVAKITPLAQDPRPSGCKKLKGYSDLYRIRSGDYRVLYAIDDTLYIIDIRRIAHRKEVYQ